MRRGPVLAVLVGPLLCGCGSSGAPPSRPTASRGATSGPALLRAPLRAGEVVVRGELTPKSAGPYRFAGSYRVRFEQYAPEDPRLDFSGQTPFVADLEHTQGVPALRLFRAPASSGTRTVRLHGRYYVDASFGDYPFVIRFTPQQG
jgi:hypothetical protein